MLSNVCCISNNSSYWNKIYEVSVLINWILDSCINCITFFNKLNILITLLLNHIISIIIHCCSILLIQPHYFSCTRLNTRNIEHIFLISLPFCKDILGLYWISRPLITFLLTLIEPSSRDRTCCAYNIWRLLQRKLTSATTRCRSVVNVEDDRNEKRIQIYVKHTIYNRTTIYRYRNSIALFGVTRLQGETACSPVCSPPQGTCPIYWMFRFIANWFMPVWVPALNPVPHCSSITLAPTSRSMWSRKPQFRVASSLMRRDARCESRISKRKSTKIAISTSADFPLPVIRMRLRRDVHCNSDTILSRYWLNINREGKKETGTKKSESRGKSGE